MNLRIYLSIIACSMYIISAGAQTIYTPVTIGCNYGGSPVSSTLAVASAINDAGQVTGTLNGGVMLWQNGIGQDITPVQPGNQEGGGYAINSAGVVAASVVTPHPPRTPGQPDRSRYESFAINGGSDLQVGPTTTGVASWPTGINSAGHVIGIDSTFVWLDQGTGSYTKLRTLGGSANFVSGINDSDTIVGYSSLSGATGNNPPPIPTSWQGTTITELGLLPGDTAGSATAINNVGQIVGNTFSTTSGVTTYHGVLWQGGVMTDISDGHSQVFPLAINGAGIVVGQFTGTDGLPHGFVREGTTIVDLNTRLAVPLPAGFTPSTGLSINSSGVILINAVVPHSVNACYFLLKPVQ